MTRRSPWDVLLIVGGVSWILGFAWQWFRPTLPFPLQSLGGLSLALLYWFGFVAIVVGAAGGRRFAVVAVLIPVLAALMVLVNAAWNVAPRTWFAVHRPLLEKVVDTGEVAWPLRFLTATGTVSSYGDGVRYFPQRLGLPDDAGGYLYSPTRSPNVLDIRGLLCIEPEPLGDGWWMCGLPNTGL